MKNVSIKMSRNGQKQLMVIIHSEQEGNEIMKLGIPLGRRESPA